MEVFAERVVRRKMPLYFLKSVTNGRFLEIMTLGGFRRKGGSKEDAIIFSEVCNKRAVPGNHDIRWFSQRGDFEGRCHYIFWSLSQARASWKS